MRRVLFALVFAALLCGQTKPAAAPAVTREQLEARLVELQRGRDQAMANVNAFVGAIQEIQHWLDELQPAGNPPAKGSPPAPR